MPRSTLTSLITATRNERGAGMVSVLVSLLVVAVLAAVAIPRLTTHAGGAPGGQPAATSAAAQDASAQTVAQTAQTAMAAYAASGDSGYSGATADALHALEPALVTSSATGAAYLASVVATTSEYTVVAADPLSHDSFAITDAAGTVTRTCTPAGHGGCPASGSW
jgi:competence protein ComGC